MEPFAKKQQSFEAKSSRNKIRESWVQQYVLDEFKSFGFDGAEGPRKKGPDLWVYVGRRRFDAEIEIDWKCYLDHKHHLNDDFLNVEYLIVLSERNPPKVKWKNLPPQILHIDRVHFRRWLRARSEKETQLTQPLVQLNTRMSIIANEMQEHWVTRACPDKNRSMAACPDCNNCVHFGDGTSEATHYFQELAMRFISRTNTKSGAANTISLTQVEAMQLRAFVERHAP
jgi:hypothetical protein